MLQELLPGVVPPTVGQVLPYQTLTEKTPHRIAYRPILWGCIFLIEVLSSQVTLACIKLTKKANQPTKQKHLTITLTKMNILMHSFDSRFKTAKERNKTCELENKFKGHREQRRKTDINA